MNVASVPEVYQLGDAELGARRAAAEAIAALGTVSAETLADMQAEREATEAAASEAVGLVGAAQTALQPGDVPVRAGPSIADAFSVLDARRRRGARLTHDGKLLEIAGLSIERVSSAKVRLKRLFGGGFVELNDDGSIELAGEKRAAAQRGDILRAVLGLRRLAIEVLYKDGRYTVAKAAFTPTPTGFTLRGVDGTPVITQDGATVTHHGASSTPAPAAKVINYFTPAPVVSAAAAKLNDVYRHATGEIVYAAVDRARIANWGSSSMDSSHFGPQLTALAAKYGIPAASMNGWGSDLVEHILARLGARPALLTLPGNIIPATTDDVLITVSNMPFRTNFRSTAGTLVGVAGTIRSLADGNSYLWNRASAGPELAISADTPFLSNPGRVNRNAISLLNIGKNSVGMYSAAELFAFTNLAYDWLAPERPWNLVINHFVNPGRANQATILALNALTAARYGPVHVDQYSFICKGLPQFGQTIWQVTGITPTSADLASQDLGEVPPSLSDGGVHTNTAGSNALQWLIEQTLDQLGWLAP